MTIEQIKTLFEKSGMKFKYHHWNKPPALPYGVFFCPDDYNFAADGKMYMVLNNVRAEIYTNEKSPETEKAFENVLNGEDVFYEKNEEYIESEKMFQIIYEMRL